MEKDNLYGIKGGNKPNITKDALKQMREGIPLMLEYHQITAEIRRAKYDALITQGFTKAEALELSKTLFD